MIRIENNADLLPLNTFGLRGTARRLVTYTEPEDLTELFANGTEDWLIGKMCHAGGGSNLLFVGDYDGTLLKSEIKGIEILPDRNGDSVLVKAGAGVLMDDVCAEMASRGFWGTENLSGIPGQAGAGAVQNIGAYGVEIAELIEKVDAYDIEGNAFCSFTAEECGYGYRTSIFKRPPLKGRYIITAVTLRLSVMPHPRLSYGHLAVRVSAFPTPEEVRRAVIAMRDSKLPDWHDYGNAGSYFKNVETDSAVYDRICAMVAPDLVPSYRLTDGRIKIPTAWFIERCGWKGRSNGGASVWEKQPLVIVNATGNATADDIIGLEREIIRSVRDCFMVTIEPEVEKISSSSI